MGVGVWDGVGGCPTMIPNGAVTLYAVRVSQRTHTGVSAHTLPAVANPGLTEVTHCSLVVHKKVTMENVNAKLKSTVETLYVTTSKSSILCIQLFLLWNISFRFKKLLNAQSHTHLN